MQLDLVPPTARIIDVRSGRALDYAAFRRAVGARAAVLREAVLRGDTVAMCHRDGMVLLVDLFAVWQTGAAALVLSPSLTASERSRIAAWAKPACWIGQPVSPEGIPRIAPELEDWADTQAGFCPSAQIGPSSNDAALILLTSGSTGMPKGVVLGHRALSIRLSGNIRQIGKPTLARTLVPLPLHFGHGLIGNALSALFAGGDVLLWPEPGVNGLAHLGAVLDEHAVTFMSSVPSMWRMALKLSPLPRQKMLKRVHVGSEPLPAKLWQDICDWAGTRKVYNMYGMTEAANWISGASVEDAGFIEGAVGKPWTGEWRILREDGCLAESGHGEILLHDPALMNGYANDPEATAAAFHGSWFRTGDIGELDSDGTLRIVGRRKNQINRGGIKIAAEEVELILEQHPDVQQTCAFALPDVVSGEIVAAAVVLKNGSNTSQAALQAWCAERLRQEAVPSRIIFLADIPRNDRGKKVRNAVREFAWAELGRSP